MKTPDEILDLYVQRSKQLVDLHQGMLAVKEIYEGKAEVPLPDMGEFRKSSVPNLLGQGVDQMAGRIASTVPAPSFASDQTRRSYRQARTAERVIGGWWQHDRLQQKMKHRARHLIAYGIAPTLIRLHPKTKLPVWEIRNPLHTFPALEYEPGTSHPVDVIFAYRRKLGWLIDHGYEINVRILYPKADKLDRDAEVLLIEYVDRDCTCLIATTYACYDSGEHLAHAMFYDPTVRTVALEADYHDLDMMPVTVPQRIGLETFSGQFDSMIGMYYQQAKLMALEVMAVERGIFPDTYLVSRPGEIGKFIDGPHDGRSGLVNIVAGGDVKELTTQPGYMSPQTIDRLERAQRLTAGIPAEFGGESGTNIRTGRRGDAVLSAVIDFPVAEAQEIFSNALADEDKIAIKLAKHYTGGRERTIYVGTGNTARKVTYKPGEVFVTDEHVVSYPAVGADLNNLIMGLGQRVGMGIMSKETAASLDPFIANAEQEHDQIITEGLEQAMLAGLQQQAAAGAIPPLTLSKIMQLVRSDRMELAEALNKAVEDAQKEAEKAMAAQEAAAQAQQQGMEGQMPPATPEMAAAGPTAQSLSGNPQALSPVPGPEPGVEDLGALLGALRGAGRAV